MRELSKWMCPLVVLGCLAALAACGPEDSGRFQGATGGSANAARGEALYRDHGCPLCHGPGGAGDGPLAATLVPLPRDLRSPGSYDKGTSAREVAATLAAGLPREGVLIMMPYPHIPEVDRLSIGAFIEALQEEGPQAATSTGPEVPHVTVSDGWVRATPPGSAMTGAYLKIHNSGTDPLMLLGATTDAAETVEIHRMIMEDGRMSMAPQDELEIGPGATVGLEPGGVHLMLIGLTGPLAEGQGLELELNFSYGIRRSVDLPVRREPPGEQAPRHQGEAEDA